MTRQFRRSRHSLLSRRKLLTPNLTASFAVEISYEIPCLLATATAKVRTIVIHNLPSCNELKHVPKAPQRISSRIFFCSCSCPTPRRVLPRLHDLVDEDVKSFRKLSVPSNTFSVNSITSVCRCNGLLPEFTKHKKHLLQNSRRSVERCKTIQKNVSTRSLAQKR